MVILDFCASSRPVGCRPSFTALRIRGEKNPHSLLLGHGRPSPSLLSFEQKPGQSKMSRGWSSETPAYAPAFWSFLARAIDIAASARFVSAPPDIALKKRAQTSATTPSALCNRLLRVRMVVHSLLSEGRAAEGALAASMARRCGRLAASLAGRIEALRLHGRRSPPRSARRCRSSMSPGASTRRS